MGQAQGLDGITNDQAAGGLREALGRGVQAAVAETGRPGGYFENAAIKIVMPPKLGIVEKGLRAGGMGGQVDSFVKSMNEAAEKAAPEAKVIFVSALKQMSIEDAKGIVTGGDTSGTEFFKRKTNAELTEAFRPIIEKQMANVGVNEKFQSLMGSAPKMPFMKSPTLDINGYVLQKAIDGLFYMMAQEEKKIRTNPAAQVTPLLKMVFGHR